MVDRRILHLVGWYMLWTAENECENFDDIRCHYMRVEGISLKTISEASFETPSGRFLVKPGQYVEMISSMKPNMWVTLSDEVPAWVSEKRNKASIDRTMRWLDDCLKLAITNNTGGAVFGSVVGGSKIDERKRCAQEVSKRNVSGFHIGGFGLGESMDERPAVLNAVTECLPEDKPRQISGLGLPEEVLQGVAAGIDLFNSTYVYHLTLGGFALTFPSEENRETWMQRSAE